MESETVGCSSSGTIFLINDPADDETCDLIREKLSDNKIICHGLYETPGQNLLQVFIDLVPSVKKTFFLFSHYSSKSKVLQHIMDMEHNHMQVLCVEQMQTYMFGVLVVAEKLCLQIDFDE